MASQAQVIQQKVDSFLAQMLTYGRVYATLSQLDKELSKYPALNRFDKQLPVPKSYIAVGIFFVFTVLVFFNIFAGFLTNFIGFVIPTYFSLAALETPQPQDDVQWLTYWVVFGFFNFIESFVSVVLYWFPFYYTFKTLAIVWLVLPQTQGAKLVYHKLLRPLFLTITRSAGVTPSQVSSSTGTSSASASGFSAQGLHTQ